MPVTGTVAATTAGTTAAAASTAAATAAAAAATTAGLSTATKLLLAGSLAGTIGSVFFGVQSAKAQAKTQSAIAQANSEEALERGEQLARAGRAEQRDILEERRRTLARNRAKFGKSGAMFEGSPLIAQQETAKNITLNAEQAAFNVQLGIRAAQRQSQVSLIQKKVAKDTGRLRVGEALFSGATKVANLGLEVKRAKNA